MKISSNKVHVLTLWLTLLGMLFAFNGCSSSSVSSDAEGGESPPTDAGTDAVPKAEAESPAAPADAAPPADVAKTDVAAAPAEESAPPPASTGGGTTGEMEDYVVKKGDTLMKISYQLYGDLFKWKRIYENNQDQIKDPNSIPSGIKIKVEKPEAPFNPEQSGEKYLIKKGDTLGKISDSLYGTPKRWKELWKSNKQLVKNPNKIFAGFYLYYTGATGSSADSSSGGQAPGAQAAVEAPPASAPANSPAEVPSLPPAGGAPSDNGAAAAPSDK